MLCDNASMTHNINAIADTQNLWELRGNNNDRHDLFEDYIRPQENGSHWGCEYIRLSDGQISVEAVSPIPFCFNASRFATQELTCKRHSYELVPSKTVFLTLDHAQSGVGSASCGTVLDPSYQLSDERIERTFKLLFKEEKKHGKSFFE